MAVAVAAGTAAAAGASALLRWVPFPEDLLGLEEMAQSPEISDAYFLSAKAAEMWSPETLGSRWEWWAAVMASVSVSPCSRPGAALQGDWEVITFIVPSSWPLGAVETLGPSRVGPHPLALCLWHCRHVTHG